MFLGKAWISYKYHGDCLVRAGDVVVLDNMEMKFGTMIMFQYIRLRDMSWMNGIKR